MKCELCGKETGKPTKRFCGDLSKVGSCAVKRRKQTHLERQAKNLTGIKPRHTEDSSRRIKRARDLRKKGYDDPETAQSWLGE